MRQELIQNFIQKAGRSLFIQKCVSRFQQGLAPVTLKLGQIIAQEPVAKGVNGGNTCLRKNAQQGVEVVNISSCFSIRAGFDQASLDSVFHLLGCKIGEGHDQDPGEIQVAGYSPADDAF